MLPWHAAGMANAAAANKQETEMKRRVCVAGRFIFLVG
jgi:hypothetical protein